MSGQSAAQVALRSKRFLPAGKRMSPRDLTANLAASQTARSHRPERSTAHIPKADPAKDGGVEGRPRQVWLVLIYHYPSEPARLRAAVWRRLRTLGAIYLQDAVVVLPASIEFERALRKLRHDIIEMSGSAVLLTCEVLAGEQEVLAGIRAARDSEYKKIVGKCRNFLDGIHKKHGEQHYSFAELERSGIDLEKLQKWFSQAVARDVLGAKGRDGAEEALGECASALDVYARVVYGNETDAELASSGRDGTRWRDARTRHV